MGRIRFILPSLVLTCLMVLAYLSQSHAPMRVHMLSIGFLLVGFTLPAAIAYDLAAFKRHGSICFAFSMAATLAYDNLSPWVILKTEHFGILRHSPWAYVLLLPILLLLVALSALVGTILIKWWPQSTDVR